VVGRDQVEAMVARGLSELGRNRTVDEIAATCLLVSDDGRFIADHTIDVGGGGAYHEPFGRAAFSRRRT
jgi:hypothetical protein